MQAGKIGFTKQKRVKLYYPVNDKIEKGPCVQTESGQFTVVTLADRPGMDDLFWPEKEKIWPEFMFHDLYARENWDYLAERFAEHQLYLLDDAGEPVAVVQTIPCFWDGTLSGFPIGWADSLVRGVQDQEKGKTPNTLSALEISIRSDAQGRGVSYEAVKAVRAHAEAWGFQAVIVAVRPSLKERYPITPMERYVRWQREDNTPFDPWLRVHWRCGGEILHVAHPSMVIEGSAQEWEAWTGIAFPESGEYVVPGALVPVQIDRVMNMGRYVEPNVWVHHPITTARLGPKI
jgi:GNAT superfamily N-acetyltransferase